jgi:nucleoid-associated protein YgaU
MNIKKAAASEKIFDVTKSSALQMPAGYPSPGAEITGNVFAQRTYTVKSGDTLWKIAKRHYGDGKKFRVILGANTKILKGPNLLRPGMVLVIPRMQ